MRFLLAMVLGKCAALATKIASKFTKINGTNFPGIVALRICPDFIGRVNRPKTVIGVTGTNGKTTTSNMLADVLRNAGYKVLNNSYGSNIKFGIAACLLSGVTLFNKEKYEIAVLEIDERSCLRIYPYLKPDYIVCTNLSRDSLYRNAHPYYIFNLLDKYLPDESTLILNANDLISSRLKKNNKHVFYGMDRMEGDTDTDDNLENDSRVCPECHNLLKYEYRKYNQIGRVYCPHCGYHSPDPQFSASALDYDKKAVTVRYSEGEVTVHMVSNSIYNIYNQVAAVALLKQLGLDDSRIVKAFEGINIVSSRYQLPERVNDVDIITIMAKAGTPAISGVLDYVRKEPGEKEVILFLEDTELNKTYSEHIVWLYESDFEFLLDDSITNIVICGVREQDVYLRLLLAGIPEEKITLAHTVDKVAGCLKLKKNTSVYIVHDIFKMEDRDLTKKMIKERLNRGE